MPAWFFHSTRKLAQVLGVDESAIRYQERCGAIHREEDGAWSLWDVVSDWRQNVSWYPRRAPAWLDPSRRITALMEIRLNELARTAGAERGEDEDEGEEDEGHVA